jgi:hypothetical protein
MGLHRRPRRHMDRTVPRLKSLCGRCRRRAFEDEKNTHAIPETGALLYNEGDLSFVGKICMFQRGKKTKC